MPKNERYRPPLTWSKNEVTEFRILKDTEINVEAIAEMISDELLKGNTIVIGLVDEL